MELEIVTEVPLPSEAKTKSGTKRILFIGLFLAISAALFLKFGPPEVSDQVVDFFMNVLVFGLEQFVWLRR